MGMRATPCTAVTTPRLWRISVGRCSSLSTQGTVHAKGAPVGTRLWRQRPLPFRSYSPQTRDPFTSSERASAAERLVHFAAALPERISGLILVVPFARLVDV